MIVVSIVKSPASSLSYLVDEHFYACFFCLLIKFPIKWLIESSNFPALPKKLNEEFQLETTSTPRKFTPEKNYFQLPCSLTAATCDINLMGSLGNFACEVPPSIGAHLRRDIITLGNWDNYQQVDFVY